PFKQSSFKANVFAGLLALNPFMLQNLRAFGKKLLIKRRILDELNLIFFRRRHLGFFFFHKTSIQSTKSIRDWTCQPLGLFNSPLDHAVAEAGLWQGLAELFRYPSEFGSHRRSAIFVHDRHPAISWFARGDVDRNLTEERNSQAPGFAFAAAASEDVIALPVGRRHEVTHIFDQADYGNVHFVEHGSGLARVDEGNFLWRGDDERPRKGDRLDDRKLDVTGARRQVEHQVIQLAPFNLPQKL